MVKEKRIGEGDRGFQSERLLGKDAKGPAAAGKTRKDGQKAVIEQKPAQGNTRGKNNHGTKGKKRRGRVLELFQEETVEGREIVGG